MIIKQLKNHILFEPEQNESISKLGMKAAYRQTGRILLLRKITKNGKLNIICDTEGYDKVEVDQGLTESRIAAFFKALAELLFVCDESAFLDHTYVDVSGDLIFYKEITGKFVFALIPVDGPDYAIQQKNWDERLKALAAGVFGNRTLNSPSLMEFKEGIETSIDTVSYIKDKAFSLEVTEAAPVAYDMDLELLYNGPYGSFTLYIAKDEFVIGKSSDCDGVLSMNPTVSRHHCIFRKNSGKWTVADLGSSNGTAVNGGYLAPNQMLFLNNIDSIRISDMDFMVRIANGI